MTSFKGFDINESFNDSSLLNRVKFIKAAVEESELKEYSGLRTTVINGHIKVIKILYPIYDMIQIGIYKSIIIGEVKNK